MVERAMQVLVGTVALILMIGATCLPTLADDPPEYLRDIAPLFKSRCVKCHGPVKSEAKLNLSTPVGVARGSENGAVVAAHDLEASLLWERVSADEMPPKEPLSPDEKEILRKWIVAGAPGLPTVAAGDGSAADHWAFRPLTDITPPEVSDASRVRNEVDRFIQSKLEDAKLTLGAEAPRHTLIRRVSLSLTGLPPTLAEIAQYLSDTDSGAYARMVERYLASEHYGERWGKIWLDAAGYADSNGYFNADSDRPLAYRYRDYVVRSFNRVLPFDEFIRQQLAGDELAAWTPDQPASPEIIELLEATHYLRNGQDGTNESDGNPDELRTDRYTALESCMQIVSSSLLGLTIQCAKCHDHKFEPITQADYYSLQAVFVPVFPAANVELWKKPNERFAYAPQPGEQEAWEQDVRESEQTATRLRTELAEWMRAHRQQGDVLFADNFESGDLAERWSNTAPGDDAPGGKVPVTLGADIAPSGRVQSGRLEVIEGGTEGDSWISTRQSFDWTPEQVGEAIQVTFDVVANRLSSDGTEAQRIGYFIALHDFSDNSDTPGGNILIDGNPGGSTTIYVDYPGADAVGDKAIGDTGYAPGRNYGVRVTKLEDDQYGLEHVVDGVPEEKSATLKAEDLPDGGFGFEYCCDRSFVIDNVLVERFPAPATDENPARAQFAAELQSRRKAVKEATDHHDAIKDRRPGHLSWATDLMPAPPETHLLTRGNYADPADVVTPRPFAVLTPAEKPFEVQPPSDTTTGRRLALANWLTATGSPAAALMARVQVNRIWQSHFGTGIVATPDNFGLSGSPPSHPELLDWLSGEFIRSGWSVKHVQRLILNSATFRQTSEAATECIAVDPEDRLLSRFPMHRLDAESIRDAMLAVSGDLDATLGGPYIPTDRGKNGEVVVAESHSGAHRRSIYLQHRRTQVLSLLQVFDAPSIVFNSVRRPRTAMPLQALSLLNSDFVLARSASLARRLEQEEPVEARRIARACEVTLSRLPEPDEAAALHEFLDTQSHTYGDGSVARQKAWIDLCQSLLASNEFLYID